MGCAVLGKLSVTGWCDVAQQEVELLLPTHTSWRVLFHLHHSKCSNTPTITCFYSLKNAAVCFYPFIITFNIVEHPQKKFVDVLLDSMLLKCHFRMPGFTGESLTVKWDWMLGFCTITGGTLKSRLNVMWLSAFKNYTLHLSEGFELRPCVLASEYVRRAAARSYFHLYLL